MSHESNLKLFCLAIVAKDKLPTEDKIYVFPVERLSFEEGDIEAAADSSSATVTDLYGKKAVVNYNRSSVMSADKWITDGDDGRQTSPDVVSGETVKIYRFGDSEVFFWTTLMREPSLRRLEHVAHAYSNLRGGRSPYGLDSTYGSIYSTRDKYVRIWTSTSDGEKFAYEFKFDTEQNLYRVIDNINNGFGFESQDHRTWMRNASNSYIELVKEVMTAKVGKTINLIAGLNLAVNAPVSTFSGEVKIAKNVQMGQDLHVANLIHVPDIILSGRSLVEWLNSKD